MRAFARVAPGRRMEPLLDRSLHQRMVGRMEPHQIDAPPVAVVGVELRRVLVGKHALLEIFR